MIDGRKSSVGSNSEAFHNPDDKSTREEFRKPHILADTRRHYNSQEEFVFLLYNDIVKIILTNWRRIDAPKSVLAKEFREEPATKNEVENENGKIENYEKNPEKDSKGFGLASSDWKLSLPDEYVDLEFPNKNIYTGLVSRRLMEGDGVYRWRYGESYRGEFAENSIQGRGTIEWKDHSWYEGEFLNGNRNGTGNFVSHEYGRFYIGDWSMGRKHGNGYCRYGKDADSYEGQWNSDQKQGSGHRTYENGARYVGQWDVGQRHGIGTMVWPNGDVYRGEWKNGTMNGYGEYVWNGFLNESLSWPQENSYMGEWQNGMKHGKGVLKFNSMGGEKYSGNWSMDKKHGYGMIVGNSGAITEGDPLFLNDILTPPGTDAKYLQKRNFGPSAKYGEEKLEEDLNPPGSGATKKQIKQEEPRKTTVFQPSEFPPLRFHVQRLLEPAKKKFQKTSTETISSGKCHICQSESTCACLYDPSGNAETNSAQTSYTTSSSFFTKSSGNSSDRFCSHTEKFEVKENDLRVGEKEYEEHWVHNCLTTHMSQLRKIYQIYAELYCFGKSAHPNLSMGKIALWQLMRDCGIHTRGISLVQFERYIALNKSAFIESEFYPFERIEFFQFVHILLEISWHLYTKLDDVETEVMRGRLAGGLHRLLVRDIFPNAGNLMGSVSKIHRDLLPMYSVYQLYCDVGEPHTAKKFLRSTCILEDNYNKGTGDPEALPLPRLEKTSISPSHLMINGINAITLGERLSYIPLDEKLLGSCAPEPAPIYEDDFAGELLALRHLGAPKMLFIIAKICPGIKDEETDTIINMDYELTFLEFYEILLEATKALIYWEKLSAQELEASKITAESVTRLESVKSILQSKRSSSNTSKIRKK